MLFVTDGERWRRHDIPPGLQDATDGLTATLRCERFVEVRCVIEDGHPVEGVGFSVVLTAPPAFVNEFLPALDKWIRTGGAAT